MSTAHGRVCPPKGSTLIVMAECGFVASVRHTAAPALNPAEQTLR